MGFMESAVVVYIRALYYPKGFQFPPVPVDYTIAVTEIFREAATLIMLLSMGILLGKNKAEKLAYFIFCFALWDIFYYVFLKWLLGWPSSLLTWDILFLIPIVWVGPVIAPIILSMTMVFLSAGILYYGQKNKSVIVSAPEWTLLVAGSLTVIFSFTRDFTRFIFSRYSFAELMQLSADKKLFELSLNYIPVTFDWIIFGLGEVLLLSAVVIFIRRNSCS
ncbi:hypothetical protein F9K33_12615 [bacterium]|nr:MAG: hypothetical protein F9K33_12615 [bacterium]